MIVACAGSLTISNEANTVNYPTNKMTLTTMTYDKTTTQCSMYRNNILLGTFSSTSTSNIRTSFAIGRIGAYSSYYWYGTLADARIYDHALSSDEVNTLYSLGPNGIPKSKLDYFIISILPTLLPSTLSRNF